MTDAVEVRGAGRDPQELRTRLAEWFSRRLPGAEPEVSSVERPESNGMSSESVMFDVELALEGVRRTLPCVARLAPEASSVPVFPVYDMESQFRVIELVAEQTDVPVPTPRWLETANAPLGTPFFVMDRLEGRVPPDVMPYNFGSWLMEAEHADQDHLVAATMEVLAGIHTVTPANADLDFLSLDTAGETPLRRHFSAARGYYEWATGDVAIPVLERCFDWLDQRWPTHEGPAVLNWGDARIGNVLYDGFDPVGVLDWEMAGVGPPEVDLAWGIFLHRFFEDIAADAGLPGMPDFLRMDDVASTYEHLSGYTPRDMPWFMVYSALRHGIVMSRIQLRQVQLGVAERVADPDDMVLHRRTLEQMMDGTYWSQV